jgi:hypothetical protein
MVRSEHPTGVLIPVVYLFGGDESKAKNSKVAHEYAEHREHGELILVRASGEQYLTSSCRCRFLEDWSRWSYTRDRLIRLILAGGWGQFPDSWSVTTRRPKSSLHILPYPVDLLWAKSTEVLPCLLCQVLRSWGTRSSGESSGRSLGGRVGCQLGRLGPWQIGRSSSRPDPLVGHDHEPGRWGPRGTHVSQAPEWGIGATTLGRSWWSHRAIDRSSSMHVGQERK